MERRKIFSQEKFKSLKAIKRHSTSRKTEWEFSKTIQKVKVARSFSVYSVPQAKSQLSQAIWSKKN
jgi:hypothetical protein